MNREYNIKEKGFRAVYKGIPPFMKYEKGHGYIGVLLEDEITGELQCHLCGKLANNLAKHIFHNHKETNSRQYKESVGLNMHTPLMSENIRRKQKNNFLNLTEEKKEEVIARLRSLNKSNHKEKKIKPRKDKGGSSEMQNKFGTCPEQAKTLFWEEYNKLGRIPKNKEMSEKLRHIIYTRFSNYKEALLVWGISEREYREHIVNGQINANEKRRENDYFPKYSKEEVYQKYSDFYFEKKRMPTWGEVAQYNLPTRSVFIRVFGGNKSDIQRQFNLKLKELKTKENATIRNQI